MKAVEELNNRKVPIVAIDHALDKYRDHVNFPAKLDKANTMLKTANLPPNQHSDFKNPGTKKKVS